MRGDRRALDVSLTDEGRRAAEAFHVDAVERLNGLLAPLSPTQIEVFVARWARLSRQTPFEQGKEFEVSVIDDDEREYLSSGVRLGRLATVAPDGAPHVVPAGFQCNPELDTIDIGGHDFAKRKKYREVLSNPQVRLVVYDHASVNPWQPRRIEILGEAQGLDSGGSDVNPGFDPEMFRITPEAGRELGTYGTDVAQGKNHPAGSDRGRAVMSFDTRNGTRGGRQPRGALMRWVNKLAARRIARRGKMPGLGFDALVLTTVGARSGLEREVPLGWFPGRDGSWLIVAAAAGAPNNPAWYYNLAANPHRVYVEIPGRKVAVTAEQLHGAEREEAWRQITAAAPQFVKYQHQTDRELPVIRLMPKPA